MSVQVNIDEVRRLQARRREINRVPLQDIIWVDDTGKVFPVTPAQVEHHRFTGLNNIDFVEFTFSE